MFINDLRSHSNVPEFNLGHGPGKSRAPGGHVSPYQQGQVAWAYKRALAGVVASTWPP